MRISDCSSDVCSSDLLVRHNQTTDRIRTFLSSLKVLQDSQVKTAQTKLMQAGIRKKEYAVAVIFGRLVLPIVIGGGMALWVYGMGALAEWSAFKRYGIVATALILAYQAPDLYLKNQLNNRTDPTPKALPDENGKA